VRQAHIQGLIETWNILRDEQAVKQIRQGIADIEAGRVVAWENARMKPNFK